MAGKRGAFFEGAGGRLADADPVAGLSGNSLLLTAVNQHHRAGEADFCFQRSEFSIFPFKGEGVPAGNAHAFQRAGMPLSGKSGEKVRFSVVKADQGFQNRCGFSEVSVNLEQTGRMEVEKADGSKVLNQGSKVLVKF